MGRAGFVLCAAMFAAGLHSPTVARGQEAAIQSNDYAIDLVEGPVLGPQRIVGLGGAYTALVSGIDGSPWNPAGYASRELWELDWYEWEIDAGILIPLSFSNNDFFNAGSEQGFRFKNFVFLNFGGRLLFGNFGLGALVRYRTFSIRQPGGDDVNVNFALTNFGGAYQLLDGQLVVGAGARLATFSLSATQPGTDLVSGTAIGAEMGVILRSAKVPWRVGGTLRSPAVSGRVNGIKDESGDGVERAAGFILPESVYLPWEVQLGFAIQFGPKPLNRIWQIDDHTREHYERELTLRRYKRERDEVERVHGTGAFEEDAYAWLPARATDPEWLAEERKRRRLERLAFDEEVDRLVDAHEAREQIMPRGYVLLTSDLLIVGPTTNGVGVEGFLAQQQVRSGRDVTASVRVGTETEPIRNWVKTRVGTYLEPSRVRSGNARMHWTSGVDFKLFRWDLFGILDPFTIRVTGTMDLAPRYFDWGLGIGVWH
jgi:hypothetical protein